MVSMDQPLIRNNLLPSMMMMISVNEDLLRYLKLDFGFIDIILTIMKMKKKTCCERLGILESYDINGKNNDDKHVIGDDKNIDKVTKLRKCLVASSN